MTEVAVQIPQKRKGKWVPGPGRPRGSKNRRTQALEAALDEAKALLKEKVPPHVDVDAHGLLVAVYQDPRMPVTVRIEAARAALRVEKPSLAATALTGDLDVRLAHRLDTALARCRGDAVLVAPVVAAIEAPR